MLNYIILTTHSSHLYSMWNFTHTCNPTEIGKWRLTSFYGNLKTHRRDDSWALLERLGKQDDSPWVCIGDFNEVLSVNEKEGGANRLSR